MDKMVYAKAKNQRISPRKARLIINLIKGENALEVSQKLPYINKKAAGIVKKVLDSAIANAKNNHDVVDLESMVISEARVDEGFTLKRGRPVSKGRYHRIFKRNSHITIGLV